MIEETNELLDAYNNLTLIQKRKELAEEFTELLGVINKLKEDIGVLEKIDLNPLKKLYDTNISEDEYISSIYENMLNLKEELAEYLDKVIDLYYENENLE